MFNVSTVDTIVWDFDGVLNRNIVDGKFTWNDGFEAEFGQSIETFNEMIFNDKFSELKSNRSSLGMGRVRSVGNTATSFGENK